MIHACVYGGCMWELNGGHTKKTASHVCHETGS